jgi:DNA polymerase
VSLAEARRGVVKKGTAADWIPPRPTLPKVRATAMGCRACHLWTLGTQTVFGEGATRAAVMVIGEQPGDKEDLAGRPFVGPSGRLLDEAFEEAGIDRRQVYVTNVVKHFKWERGEKGKRRIHKKPNSAEITACRPWMDAEIALVKPRVVICLGATAAQTILGKQFRVTAARGTPVESAVAEVVIATVHPSSVLRAPDAAARAQAERDFKADIRAAAKYV